MGGYKETTETEWKFARKVVGEEDCVEEDDGIVFAKQRVAPRPSKFVY